jgi:hypothetical protein
MYVPGRELDVPYSQAFRYLGRFGAVILFCSWIAMLITDFRNGNVGNPTSGMILQAAALAIVFAGYAIGWRHEFSGGLLAIIGTAVFFVVSAISFGIAAGVSFGAAGWFAAPGVLYLLAWYCDQARNRHLGGVT